MKENESKRQHWGESVKGRVSSDYKAPTGLAATKFHDIVDDINPGLLYGPKPRPYGSIVRMG